MSDDAITKALEVAAKQVCCWAGPCKVESGALNPPCCRPWHHERAAATIAAFLEAVHAAPGDHRQWTLRELAAAIRRAGGAA